MLQEIRRENESEMRNTHIFIQISHRLGDEQRIEDLIVGDAINMINH